MSDYIKREDAIELCAEAQGRASTKSELKGISRIWQKLLKLPPAEAVEVVRCKDCEFWDKCDENILNGGICDEWSDFEDSIINYTKPDDYCSFGERKDEE